MILYKTLKIGIIFSLIVKFYCSNAISHLLSTYLESTKANGREPKTCLGLVFNYKLGCFNDVGVFIYADSRPHQ